MIDDVAAFAKERWEALAEAGVPYSLPWRDLTPEVARERLDPLGLLGDLRGQRALCLAGGGGQQSAALGLLGAEVTVLDLCETQLSRDREAAALYGLSPRLEQGDMRDLSRFGEARFDLVWHAHALLFVPDARTVFAEVARVVRPGGVYRLETWNPYCQGIDERTWNGRGYLLEHPYRDCEVDWFDDEWEIAAEGGDVVRVQGPREFLHTLPTLINGTAEFGFRIFHYEEQLPDRAPDAGPPEPGTMDHLATLLPPYVALWMRRDA